MHRLVFISPHYKELLCWVAPEELYQSMDEEGEDDLQADWQESEHVFWGGGVGGAQLIQVMDQINHSKLHKANEALKATYICMNSWKHSPVVCCLVLAVLSSNIQRPLRWNQSHMSVPAYLLYK